MERRVFERALACHCAPALLGVKAASLISLSAREYPKLETLAGEYNAKVSGPRFLVLGHCKERSLLLVYRPQLLEEALSHPLARAMLAEAGYPVEPKGSNPPLPWLLRKLMDRLEGEGDFPHEVGLFLGYPPEDVESFLANPEGCKLCGCWKVYHDVEGAKRLFRKFDACRTWLLKRLDGGEDLPSILERRAA